MFSHSCSWISRKVFKRGGGVHAALTSAAKFINRAYFGWCAVRGWTLLSIFSREHSILLLPHWVCWIPFLRRNFLRNKAYYHSFDWPNNEQSFFFVVALVLVILTRMVSLECIFCARKLQHVIDLASAPYSNQELSPIFETILSLLQQCIKLI